MLLKEAPPPPVGVDEEEPAKFSKSKRKRELQIEREKAAIAYKAAGPYLPVSMVIDFCKKVSIAYLDEVGNIFYLQLYEHSLDPERCLCTE